jgi:hypothetical protein
VGEEHSDSPINPLWRWLPEVHLQDLGTEEQRDIIQRYVDQGYGLLLLAEDGTRCAAYPGEDAPEPLRGLPRWFPPMSHASKSTNLALPAHGAEMALNHQEELRNDRAS